MLTEKPALKSIAEQTVLLKVSFGLLGNSKRVPTSLIKGAEGKKKLLKIHKVLFESKELTAIQNADMQFRQYLDKVSMPFDAPLRLVALGAEGAHIQKVHENILAYAVHRAELVDMFITAYPMLCIEYRDRMMELSKELDVPFEILWNASDCPIAEEARAQFTFTFGYHSFSAPDQLKLTKIYDDAKMNAEDKVTKAADAITILMREKFLELVSKLKEALEPTPEGKVKRLYSSNVKNIQEFIAEFKNMNITNDSELEELVNEVSSVIDPKFSVDQIKSDDSFKVKLESQLEGFTDKLEGLVQVVPGRKFKDI